MAQTFYPTLQYRDAQAAIAWLREAFGFEPRMVHAGGDDRPVAHAELVLRGAIIMLGSTPGDGDRVPRSGPQATYVAIDDPDALHARAVAAGAEVLMEPTDQPYGSRDFGVRDPEGNTWWFGTYAPSPSDPVS